MWSDTAGSEVTALLAGYLADLTAKGHLDVTDPDLTARQFVVLLAGEGRARSLHGIRPLSPAERRTISHDTAGLIIRASRAAHAVH